MTSRPGCIMRLTRRLIYHPDELHQLAEEFGGYAAHEIADIVQLQSGTPRLTQKFQLITGEVAFAIRCAVERLPEEPLPPHRYLPARARRREHYELLRRVHQES